MTSVLGNKSTKSMLEVKVNLFLNPLSNTIEKGGVNYLNILYLSTA
ncbi:MAG: hypothetical protein AAF489_10495 [Bacteroidota bacterium]